MHAITDKAAGADDIFPKFLSELKEELCFPVTLIMTASLESGIMPEGWKLANVTFIFKKGSKCDVENYRPVSLFCKLIEGIVRDSILNHLEKIICLAHGFKKV